MEFSLLNRQKPFWIAGPCVIESKDLCAQIAQKLKEISLLHEIPFVFKASFDKANRTSKKSYRGPGLEEGLQVLQWIKKEFELPVLTDIHETSQAKAVAEVVDILQIPAFLCRQTDLLEAACKTQKPINVKKGQFLAPSQVTALREKLQSFGAKQYWLTERGSSFGYGRLVVDFAAIPELRKSEMPLILDITHSVQLPGAEITGGIREAIPFLAKAGAACGFEGFFAETHPDPSKALSDAANAWPLKDLEKLCLTVKRIHEVSIAN